MARTGLDGTITTDHLAIRPALEGDREQFVRLLADDSFMLFSEGPLHGEAGERWFDEMLAVAAELPFGRRAVIELSSGEVIGYVGAAYVEYRGERRLEFGYRLVEAARGRGYATEACRAILALARECHRGDLFAFVDPGNEASRNVLRKLGFHLVERIEPDGPSSVVYRLML